jgi:transposase
MAKAKKRYTPEFRRQMVELHRAGRRFDELGREFGVTSWSIRQWVKRAERDGGTGDGGLTTTEREELTKLRRENRRPSGGRRQLTPRLNLAWSVQSIIGAIDIFLDTDRWELSVICW